MKQEIVKYLGRSSKVTIKDIPREFHEDPNILAFIAAHSSDMKKTEEMEFSMREKILDYSLTMILKLFSKYLKDIQGFLDLSNSMKDY